MMTQISKRILSVLLSGWMLLSLTGCGEGSTSSSAPQAAPVEGEAQPPPAASPGQEMSGQIIIGTHEIGTGGYQSVALMIEGMVAVFPDLQIRALPAGTESTRAYYGRLGDAQAIISGGATPYYLQEGINGFETMEWGPQAIGGVFIGPHNGYTLGVQETSDIYEVADLKGKKVARTPASPSTVTSTEAMLAFAGLSWDDVEPVDFPSSAQGYEGLADGKIDACFYNITAAKAYEAQGTPGGLRFLSFPQDDTAGWERVRQVSPIEVPKTAVNGAGVSEENPIEVMSSPYPIYIAWDDVDEDTIYTLTKAIVESRDEWAAKDSGLEKDFTLEMHWQLFDAGNTPMHKGAVRYYSETGQWTDEREAKNNEILDRQAKLKELWDKTVEQAQEQAIPSSEFDVFWLEARAAAGM